MKAHYKKLWKILIDKEMSKRDLARAANISGGTLTKLVKSENVNVEVLLKICTALQCGMDDIMDIVPDEVEKDIRE